VFGRPLEAERATGLDQDHVIVIQTGIESGCAGLAVGHLHDLFACHTGGTRALGNERRLGADRDEQAHAGGMRFLTEFAMAAF
jgi:hypothetical protein